MDTQILGWMDGLSRWRVTWGEYLRFSQLESLILRFPPRLTKIGNAEFNNTMILYTFLDPTTRFTPPRNSSTQSAVSRLQGCTSPKSSRQSYTSCAPDFSLKAALCDHNKQQSLTPTKSSYTHRSSMESACFKAD
jgi:hypothetical protein